MSQFAAVVALILVSLPFPTLATLAFYGPEVPCIEWMTTGDFLVANCPANGYRATSVMDLNRKLALTDMFFPGNFSCYEFMDDDTIEAGDGHFITASNCTFEPVLNGGNSTAITCPSHQPGKGNVTSHIMLAHVENRNGLLWCGDIEGCYIDSPGCLSCQDTWIKDGDRCK
ncbi:hypothetical protein PFICI_00438 [Pestalotiopsis fici W106-1]|uniref:Cyanovirin-N domain-containing protein n=1 Tax=Pestalotiopsis fici (strain W106-1 / CGMCC3.15140) TaxID=1229662 RepID=W3XKT8_PESFW|nr:uncharacterized protein PFICI_00438 [Pestalotiopsis fici W106-1]ETS86610.1 hypothetical protein PFICI_00438 [Pestalotiopsis fici W106-1]